MKITVTCQACDGTGRRRFNDPETPDHVTYECDECGGDGVHEPRSVAEPYFPKITLNLKAVEAFEPTIPVELVQPGITEHVAKLLLKAGVSEAATHIFRDDANAGDAEHFWATVGQWVTIEP